MLYLSPILLCILLNLLLIQVISSLNMQKISLNKSSIILTSTLFSLVAFISMELGKFINLYLLKSYSSMFGGILLLFIGINYLIEHKKIIEYADGYDTSFYYETFSKYRKYFFTPNIIDFNNSKCIEINESIYISIPLSLCTFLIFFAAGINLDNIPATLFTLFTSTTIILCTNFLKKLYVLNTFFKKYCFLMVSIVLIFYGFLKILI